MSLNDAVFQVHLYVEKIHISPYHVDPISGRIEFESRYLKPKCQRLNIVALLCQFAIFCFSLARVVWLFYHWKTYTVFHLDQGMGYLFIITGDFLLITVIFTQSRNHNGMIYMVNQINNIVRKPEFRVFARQLKIAGFFTSTDRQIFIYGLTLAFVLIIPAFFCGPFAVDWCPVQILLNSNHFLVKMLAGAIYGPMVYSGAIPFLSILLLLIAFLEGMYTFTLPFTESKNLKPTALRKGYRVFQMAILLMRATNEVIEEFATVLIFLGILLASSSAFIVLTMYDMLNFFSYLGVLFLLLVCFAIALSLTFLANLPRKNLFSFKSVWLGVKLGREGRKLLKACRPTGFKAGPYGIATSKLGLCICEDIVRNTVTLLLLKTNC